MAAQPEGSATPTSTIPQMSTYDVNTQVLSMADYRITHSAPTIHKIGQIGTYGGLSLVALGTAFYIYNKLVPIPGGSDVMPPRFGVPMMGWVLGGALTALSLPIHLWGIHLTNQSDTSTFLPKGTRLGWGGIIDAYWGIPGNLSLGATYGHNLNPNLFVGAGAGVAYKFGSTYDCAVPAYLNLRWQFSTSRIAPSVGVKFGADLNNQLPYYSVDWGVRVRCKESAKSWWYGLSLSSFHHLDIFGIRISRAL